jgi:hypothetical protein
MGECQVCDDIWQMFADPGNAKREIVVGSFEQALASPCRKHTPILEWFKTSVNSFYLWHSSHFPRFPTSTVTTNVGFSNSGGRDSTVNLRESVDSNYRFPNASIPMLLANKEDVIDHPGTARILDAGWVNIDTVKRWISQCVQSHTSCTTATNAMPTIPALLVDVKRKCVVSGIHGYRYVALSYRFGKAAHFRMDIVRLDELRQDLALDSLEFLASLPWTVRHAIALVESLGERYLWTDTLCITHEDTSNLAGQLEHMAAIYSSALFTIVAVDGDGKTGILGLSGISEPREINQPVVEFGSEHLVPRTPDRVDHSHASQLPYHRRCWTYQEFLMSARKLIFSGGEAHWLCQCCEWHEGLVRDVEIAKHIDPRPKLLIAGFPDLSSLQDLLTNYNTRSLTFNEDALPAIAGLLEVLSRTFIGGFNYGIPEMMFDTALAWNALSRTPRIPGLLKRTPSPSARNLPSWSWLSWQGPFEWGSVGEAEVRDTDIRNHDKELLSQETSPITEWYASDALHGEPRRRIVPTWYKERERAKDDHQPLSDGWTRCEPTAGLRDGRMRFFPDGCGSHLYKHRDSLVRNHFILGFNVPNYWYYPFHVPSIDTSTPFTNPAQMRYLFSKTCKSTLLACRRLWTGENQYENKYGVLYLHEDTSLPAIGEIQLHNDEQMNRWPKPEFTGNDDPKPSTRRIDVVAINRVVIYSTRKDPTGQAFLPIARKEHVTVLWVEWEDGVAYRQACGRIEREAWEALDLEEIDLVLG